MKLIAITNRKLCQGDFLSRIEWLAKARPTAIMLREKDLSLEDYEALALKVSDICRENSVPLIINQNLAVAKKLKLANIHLSMVDFRKNKDELVAFTNIGASVHSVSEAIEAEALGATYLVAGHIFSTDSKKGVPPRGLGFLKEVCGAVSIPVFAIGGIKETNINEVLAVGASGACIMSSAMTSDSLPAF
ncbi:thiamine phosphate synthase [Bacillus sp. DNRA2]|uniref:thiamine phosphate synthase n=1 Tax=Bacillus sp. DNRA2 TaxID=2723053 RepID=UPI001B7CE43B|nr:thiamine phosphate synthase [Bacillus sp. DNRA2]